MSVLREANHEGVGVAVLSDWHEDALRHKYDPIPDDGPRHRKKAKKRRVRSDHKHEYETVCVDAHSFEWRDGEWVPYMNIVRRCKVCGRVGNVRSRSDLHETPSDMPLYVVDGLDYLLGSRELPESRRVR